MFSKLCNAPDMLKWHVKDAATGDGGGSFYVDPNSRLVKFRLSRDQRSTEMKQAGMKEKTVFYLEGFFKSSKMWVDWVSWIALLANSNFHRIVCADCDISDVNLTRYNIDKKFIGFGLLGTTPREKLAKEQRETLALAAKEMLRIMKKVDAIFHPATDERLVEQQRREIRSVPADAPIYRPIYEITQDSTTA